MKKVGPKIRALREELGLNQKEFGKLVLVDHNTESKWEQREEVPGGAHKKKVEFLLQVGEHQELKEVIKKTIESDGGISAAAGLVGMLFGIANAQGISVNNLWQQLSFDSYLMVGINKLKQRRMNEKPPEN